MPRDGVALSVSTALRHPRLQREAAASALALLRRGHCIPRASQNHADHWGPLARIRLACGERRRSLWCPEMAVLQRRLRSVLAVVAVAALRRLVAEALLALHRLVSRRRHCLSRFRVSTRKRNASGPVVQLFILAPVRS